MKIAKKIMSIALVFIVAFALYGCSFLDFGANKIDAPQVQLDGNKLVWNSVSENASYEVEFTYEDGTKEVFVVTVTEYKISFEKEATVKVKALIDGKSSKYSNEVKIEKPALTQLSKPRNVKVDGNKVVWDKVEYATGYDVTVNGKTSQTTDNSIILESSAENIRIEVKALSDILLDSASTYIEVSNAQPAAHSYVSNKFESAIAQIIESNGCSKRDVDFIYRNSLSSVSNLNISFDYTVNIHNISGAVYDIVAYYMSNATHPDQQPLVDLVNSISKSEFQELVLQVYCDYEGAMKEIETLLEVIPSKFIELFSSMLGNKEKYNAKIEETKALIASTVDSVKSYISSLKDYEEVLDKVLVSLSSYIEIYTGLGLNLNKIDSSDVLEKIYFLLDYFKTLDQSDFTYIVTNMVGYMNNLEDEYRVKSLLYIGVDFAEYIYTNKDQFDIEVTVDSEVIYNALVKLFESQTGNTTSAYEFLNQLGVTKDSIKELLDTLSYIYNKYNKEVDLSSYFVNKSKTVDEIYNLLVPQTNVVAQLPKLTNEHKEFLLKIEATDFVKLFECQIVKNVIALSLNVSVDSYDKYISILKEESNSQYKILVEVLFEAYNAAVDYKLYEVANDQYATEYELMYTVCKVLTKTSSKLDLYTFQTLLSSKLAYQIMLDTKVVTNSESYDQLYASLTSMYVEVMSKVNEVSSYSSLSNDCKAKIDELMNYISSLTM